MVRRILEQQQPLCATLLEGLMPTDSKFSVMENYGVIIKPLISKTEAIGTENGSLNEC